MVTALDIGYQGYTLQDVGKFQIQGKNVQSLKQNKSKQKKQPSRKISLNKDRPIRVKHRAQSSTEEHKGRGKTHKEGRARTSLKRRLFQLRLPSRLKQKGACHHPPRKPWRAATWFG